VSVDPWVPPEWHVTVTDPWQPPPEAPRVRAVRPREDGVVALLTALFTALTGPVVGLVWTALAPKLSVSRAIHGDEAAFKTQIGADAWFLFVALAAGVLVAAVAIWVFRVRGPGAVVGLAVGGLAAAFAADRVGYLVDHASTLTALHAAGVKDPSKLGVSLLDFRLRALGVVTAWPIGSVVVLGIVEFIEGRRR
jgi:hypothetical protein